MSELLRCQACGGAVVWDAAQVGAACLFCATVALELQVGTEPPPAPDMYLPPTVERATAQARFRAWATSSWFRPTQLRTVEVTLHAMLLPAWRFHADIESHWAGLRRAATRSGRAPCAGVEHIELVQMVPASSGLSQAELTGLQPFDELQSRAWSAAAELDDLIWEPPALTERGARIRAHGELAERHRREIMRGQSLVSAKVSAVITQRDVRLLLLPIYIGSFRFRDRPWRFLVNAQSGEVVGEAPLDWRRVFAVAFGVALLALLLVLLAQRW